MEQDAESTTSPPPAAVATAESAPPSGRFGGLFTPPNLRKDIQALPDVFARKRNWAAFAILLIGFLIDAGFFWATCPPTQSRSRCWHSR